jgi:hypothetical protein
MKKAEPIGTRNMDTSGKTHPTSTQGIASPRDSKGEMKEGTSKGDAKKTRERVVESNRRS